MDEAVPDHARKVDRAALDDLQTHLLFEARHAVRSAYAPYSEYEVGAAVLTDQDTFVQGSNTENASYGAAICAERDALTTVGKTGDYGVEALAVMGVPRGEADSPYGSPCGICRQFMYEFADRQGEDFPVYLPRLEEGELADEVLVSSAEQLLPNGFGPEDVGVDVAAYLDG